MKSVSLKLEQVIFEETERIVAQKSISRNKYINDAVEYYNKIQRRDLIEKKLKAESDLSKKFW
jgi:metal-responsive CopG/Arc/MetJ family transcriptional regulator